MNPELLFVLLLVGPAAIGQTYFVYRYLRYSPGWKMSKVGRALMVKSVALCILVDVFVFSETIYYFGGPTLIALGELLEVISYVGVTIAIYWQLVTLIKTQDRERHDG